MKKLAYVGLMLMAFISVSHVSQAQTQKEWTKKDADKWYYTWVKSQKGLHPNPMIDTQEFAKQYHAHKEWWDKAFAYLERSALATLPVGKHDIDGDNVSVVVSEGPGHDFSTTRWESHKAVADIHYLITGEELVGIAPIATAIVTKPFAGTSDSAGYTSEGKSYAYIPHTFFIIFPSQIHQPRIKSPGSDGYKKIVVKVKVI